MSHNQQITDSEVSTVNNTQPFYVVSKQKFIILHIATFGMYAFYWFWKQWTVWKKYSKEELWAIPRAIFAIFFTHSLFSIINQKANQTTGKVLPTIQNAATVFVVYLVLSSIINKLTMTTPIIFDIPLIAVSLIVSIWALWQGQEQANIASDDINGQSNEKLTAFNYFWIVLGIIFWLLLIFAAYLDIVDPI